MTRRSLSTRDRVKVFSAADGVCCAVKGCGERRHALGWCGVHYRKFRATGTPYGSFIRRPSRVQQRPEDVFAKHFETDDPDKCWMWKGSITNRGYGQFMAAKKQYAAHRFSYRLHKGPIEKGMFVCHTCDVPACVNPNHLWLGTPKDNMVDKSKKGKATRLPGASNPRAKLSEDDVRAIIADVRPYPVISSQYGVSKSCISLIKRGVNWSHVKGL